MYSIYLKKLHNNLGGQVYHLPLFFHVRHSNHPKIKMLDAHVSNNTVYSTVIPTQAARFNTKIKNSAFSSYTALLLFK